MAGSSWRHTQAFFEKDPLKLVRAGLACIPEGSQYAECIRNAIAWYQENPDDWTQTWRKIEDKYNRNPPAAGHSAGRGEAPCSTSTPRSAAYIAQGCCMARATSTSHHHFCRAGQDSDCNPSNVGGVLFTTLGFSRSPTNSEKLDESQYWSHTSYNFRS